MRGPYSEEAFSTMVSVEQGVWNSIFDPKCGGFLEPGFRVFEDWMMSEEGTTGWTIDRTLREELWTT